MNNCISVIIPCYNEGPRVASLVRHVFSVFDNDVQIIVSDQSHDQIIYHGLKKYIDKNSKDAGQNFVYTKSPGNCRAETMNHGAKFATGDIVLFLHADNLLPIEANHELRNVDLDKYIGGGFLKLYSPVTFWTSIMTAIWNLRRAKSKQFFGDNAMWCDKRIFKKLGGFPRMKLFEDVKFSQMMSDYALLHKKDMYVSKYPTITSSRKYIEGGFWKVFLMQTKLQFLYKIGLYSDMFQKEYYKK